MSEQDDLRWWQARLCFGRRPASLVCLLDDLMHALGADVIWRVGSRARPNPICEWHDDLLIARDPKREETK